MNIIKLILKARRKSKLRNRVLRKIILAILLVFSCFLAGMVGYQISENIVKENVVDASENATTSVITVTDETQKLADETKEITQKEENISTTQKCDVFEHGKCKSNYEVKRMWTNSSRNDCVKFQRGNTSNYNGELICR